MNQDQRRDSSKLKCGTGRFRHRRRYMSMNSFCLEAGTASSGWRKEAQAAQIQTTRNAQEFLRRDTKRGHILGVVAMLAAMGGAIYCVHVDHAGVAVAFLSVTVMAVVRALIETAKSSHATVQMTPTGPPSADLSNSRAQSGTRDRGEAGSGC